MHYYDLPDEDHCEPDPDEQLYENPVYYEPAQRLLDLDQDDLGAPEDPDLLARLLRMRGRVPVDKRGLTCPDCRKKRRRRVPMFLVQRGGRLFASHYRKPGDPPISHESDEHRARKERIAKDCDDHGFTADLESVTAGGLARLDVRVQGADGLILGYEPQLSSQSTRGLRRREGVRRRAKVRTVWDFTDPDHVGIGTVPYVRTPDLPASVIRVQKNPIAVRDGTYALQEGRCSPAGAILQCPVNYDPRKPNDPGYCGHWHLFLTPSARVKDDEYLNGPELTLTRFAVEAAAGEHVPFERDGLHGWLPAEHWRRYLEAVGPAPEEADGPQEATAATARDGDRITLCTKDRSPSTIRTPKQRRGSRTILLETRDQDGNEPETERASTPPERGTRMTHRPEAGHAGTLAAPHTSTTPPCHICGNPASLNGPQGKPEHWSCLTPEQQYARLNRPA
jgi:hypothetical protein